MTARALPALRSAAALLLASALATTGTTAAHAAPPTLTAAVTAAVVTLPFGDGFRDTQSVTLSSDDQVTVDVALTDADDAPVATVASGRVLRATGPEQYGATVAVPLGGLAAGAYTLTATATTDGTVTASVPFTVGSGEPAAVAVTATRSTAFPADDGWQDGVPLTVAGVDETGTALPLQGTATVTAGSASRTTAFPITAPPGKVEAAVDGLPAGPASVAVTARGPSGPMRTSAAVPLTLQPTELTALTIERDRKRVYPRRDDFRDDVTFTVRGTATTKRVAPATGAAVLRRGSRVVTSWPIRSTWTSIVWDGRVGTTIVPGDYTLTATAKGPDGRTRTATSTVVVSAKRAVHRTLEKRYGASSVLRDALAFDPAGRSTCAADGKAYRCTARAGEFESAIVALGHVTVPKAVRSAVRWEAPQVAVTMRVTKATTDGLWSIGSPSDAVGGDLERGSRTARFALSEDASHLAAQVLLFGSGTVVVDRFTVTYRYLTLE